MKTLLTIALCLSLSGCMSYTRNENASQLEIDDAQCRAQAATMIGAAPLQIVMFRQACMEGKGWK